MIKTHTIAFLVSVFVGFQIHSQNYFNVLDSIKFLNTATTIRNDTIITIGDMWNDGIRAINVSNHELNGNLLNHDTLSSYPELTSTASLFFSK